MKRLSAWFDFRTIGSSVLSEDCIYIKYNVTLWNRKLDFPSYSYRSCNISLFCFFHWSLKSEENSCQTENKVLGETSFSPALGLTEKETLNSKKLRMENNNITSRPNYYNMRLQKPTMSVVKPGHAEKICKIWKLILEKYAFSEI